MRLSKEITNKANRPERVLQFGEGNFLRAFTDWIIHSLNKETTFDSSIVVVQPIENGLIDKLNEQDGLYTLYLKGIKNGEVMSNHEVIDAISRGINPYDNYESYMETATLEDMRFVISNTTEAGIYYEKEDKLEDKPQKSFPGKLTSWLYKRYQHFNGDKNKGMVIIPCELINKNADKLKEVILQLASDWELEEGFIRWIHEANTFCNSLVDRIVPGYPRDRIAEITDELGYEDHMVVEGEQFHLWVIEAPEWLGKEFPANKVDGLNVLFVKDLTPYRTRKVRILNGAHTSTVPVGYLYGLRTVRESVEDQVIGKYILNTMYEEIVPTLTLSKEELEAFAKDVIERFKNPYIKHYLISISLNSISKYKTRVLPSLMKYYEDKKVLPKKLVLALAALVCFYKGEYKGESIELKDDMMVLEFYQNLWAAELMKEEDYHKLAIEVLSNEALWNENLTRLDGLRELLASYIQTIDQQGIDQLLEQI